MLSDRFGSWFPLILLAALAIVTFWLDRVVQPPAEPAQPSAAEPDYIVDGLFATRMDPQGNVKHTLRARKMIHYQENDTTLLAEPTLVTYGEGHAPVTVSARRARLSENGENVYFEDDVRVVRAPDRTRSELVLETSFLHVIPDENIARTDKPVTIRDATAVVTASGLELNSETRVLNLEGRVRGTFDARAARAGK